MRLLTSFILLAFVGGLLAACTGPLPQHTPKAHEKRGILWDRGEQH